MKKFVILLLVSIFFMTGCQSMSNTPTASVENYLKKYQNMDSEILTQLDKVISSDESMSDEQKKKYKELMINQYKNLSYKIKDESISSDEAEVEVEIEVLDYATNISEAKTYYKNHQDEFKMDDDVVGGAVGDAIDKVSSFIDYKIEQLNKVEDKTTYDMTFYLTKIDNEWVVNELSDKDIQRLHGLYEG